MWMLKKVVNLYSPVKPRFRELQGLPKQQRQGQPPVGRDEIRRIRFDTWIARVWKEGQWKRWGTGHRHPDGTVNNAQHVKYPDKPQSLGRLHERRGVSWILHLKLKELVTIRFTTA